mmetsp:Transcript_34732/g.56249  ORF Transcript_34732/g.56249 Transcript_34732/m.56249 type:complete len:143 (+) Transcript_34732:352-780(+)
MTLSARSHGAGKSPPGGVEPLFFTSTSQEIFRIRTGEDVTREHPHRYIPKQDILNDIQFRGVISDFHPVKDRVKEYPGDELLIVYDDENIYDQNFYLCVTLEAKEAEIKRLEDARRAALVDVLLREKERMWKNGGQNTSYDF